MYMHIHICIYVYRVYTYVYVIYVHVLYTCMHHVRTVHVFFVAFSYTWIYVCIHFGEILRQSVTVCEGTFRVFTHKNTHKPLSCWCISNLVGLPVWN